jgi:hypothetical protein
VAIKIDFLADVAKFLRGTKDMAGALDDVAGELDGLDGDKALGKLEDGMEDAGKEAQGLESKVSDAMRKMAQESQTAGKKIGDSTQAGVREASSGLEDLKEESAGTARESAASFDGSAESITGSFQEIAANAFVGFGPAGAAAGLALAMGMGIAISAMQKTSEEATAAKQKSVDMVDAIKDAGGNLADMDLSDKIISWGREVMEDNWITFWADEASTKFQETAKDAKEAGVATRDAIRAASGSSEDSQKFLDETADDWQRLTKVIEANRGVTEDGLVTQNEAGQAAQRQRDALSDLRGQAEDNIDTTADAIEIYNLETDALDATKEAAEAAAEAVQDKADATTDAANAAMDAQGSEISWIDTLRQMTEDIKTNGKAIDNNTQAGRDNNQSLIDLAGSANNYIAAQVAAGGTTDVLTGKAQQLRDAFIDQAVAAGYPREAAEALATSYGLVPANVSTLVQAHGTEEAKAAVASVPAAATPATVEVKASGLEQAQTGITNIEGTAVDAEVKPKGTSETQQAIDGIKGRDVPITVSISNLGAIQSQLERLTAPRSVWVTVNERPGVQAP